MAVSLTVGGPTWPAPSPATPPPPAVAVGPFRAAPADVSNPTVVAVGAAAAVALAPPDSDHEKKAAAADPTEAICSGLIASIEEIHKEREGRDYTFIKEELRRYCAKEVEICSIGGTLDPISLLASFIHNFGYKSAICQALEKSLEKALGLKEGALARLVVPCGFPRGNRANFIFHCFVMYYKQRVKPGEDDTLEIPKHLATVLATQVETARIRRDFKFKDWDVELKKAIDAYEIHVMHKNPRPLVVASPYTSGTFSDQIFVRFIKKASLYGDQYKIENMFKLSWALKDTIDEHKPEESGRAVSRFSNAFNTALERYYRTNPSERTIIFGDFIVIRNQLLKEFSDLNWCCMGCMDFFICC